MKCENSGKNIQKNISRKQWRLCCKGIKIVRKRTHFLNFKSRVKSGGERLAKLKYTTQLRAN